MSLVGERRRARQRPNARLAGVRDDADQGQREEHQDAESSRVNATVRADHARFICAQPTKTRHKRYYGPRILSNSYVGLADVVARRDGSDSERSAHSSQTDCGMTPARMSQPKTVQPKQIPNESLEGCGADQG